ncbi:MAG: hypothetical protein R3345_15025, partial [Fulvivirga sp.]|nr:hypothetical protein [Fulvivirga sp.]
SCFCAVAQLNNRMFEQRNPVHLADSGKLSFGLNTLAFTKNNEYFNKIADGFTLFGYQLNPYISYQPLKNVQLDLGVYLQKDFGATGYQAIEPTYRFKYKNHGITLIFGTLEGSVSHRLIEPLYDFEKVLIDRLENGMQIVIDNESLFLDAWVDWQNMIFKGDDEQEEVTGGLSLKYKLLQKGNLTFHIPGQLVIFHRGGQIDANPNPLLTLINSSVGVESSWELGDGFFKRLNMSHHYVYYQEFESVRQETFEDGSAIYLNLSVEMKPDLEIMLSYWKGHEFISIMGGQLYPSVSSTFKNPLFVDEERELLIVRLMHNLKLADNLVLSTRFEPFFDPGNERFEFSHGFYINYTTDFVIGGKKKR